MNRQILRGVRQVLFPRALVNAFVVEADVLTVVDTGTPGGTAAILAAVRDHGRAPQDVGRILVTHRHADHAGNAAELARITGATVHVSPIEAPFIREGLEQPRPHAATPLGHLLVPYVKVALPWKLPPCPVEETLVDGASAGPFRVVATPGHTEGHVSLAWDERGILFTGDAAGHITALGPHPAADDVTVARESFGRLAELGPEAACFGHGRPIRRGAAVEFRDAADRDAARR